MVYLQFHLHAWVGGVGEIKYGPIAAARGALKGQCHKDFAVLDQFWAEIITLISSIFLERANHNKVLEDFFKKT